jgi:hypothetical protein
MFFQYFYCNEQIRSKSWSLKSVIVAWERKPGSQGLHPNAPAPVEQLPPREKVEKFERGAKPRFLRECRAIEKNIFDCSVISETF